MKQQPQTSSLMQLVGQRAVIEFTDKTLSSRIQARDEKFISLTDNWALVTRNSHYTPIEAINIAIEKCDNPQIYSLFLSTLLNPTTKNVHEYQKLWREIYRGMCYEGFIDVPGCSKINIRVEAAPNIIRPIRKIEQIYVGEAGR